MASESDILWYLRVEHRDIAGVAVVMCAGRVSSQTGPELVTALASVCDSPARGVVLDLSGVDYISSPGLRAVHGASKRLAGEGRAFVVCGLKDAVAAAFTLAGLADTLAIEPSAEGAVERARAALDTSQRDV